jgi:hypothetical protein
MSIAMSTNELPNDTNDFYSLYVAEQASLVDGGAHQPLAKDPSKSLLKRDDCKACQKFAECDACRRAATMRPGLTSGEPMIHVPETARVGLALSGGGIRSATFNLGVLQELEKKKFLKHVDYLSTVSGGGYIGGFWMGWLKERADQVPKPTDQVPKPTEHFPDTGTPGRSDSPEIRHLREFFNFIVPRKGLFKPEMWQAVVAMISGIIPTIFIGCVLVFAVIAIRRSLGLVAGPVTASFFEASGMSNPALAFAIFVGLAQGVLTGLALWGLEIKWLHGTGGDCRCLGTNLQTREEHGFVVLMSSIACGLFSGLIAYFVIWNYERSAITNFAPAAVWAVTALFLILVRYFYSWRLESKFKELGKSRRLVWIISRVIGRLLALALIWVGLTLCWKVADDLLHWTDTVGGITIGSVIGFRYLMKWFSEHANQKKVGPIMNWLRPLLPQFLSYISVAGLVILLCILAINLERMHWSTEWIMSFKSGSSPGRNYLPEILAAGMTHFKPLIVLLVAGSFAWWLVNVINPETLGLHSFYRERIASAYLRARTKNSSRCVTQIDSDDFKFESLKTVARPIHLVCCTANELAGDQLRNLARGSISTAASQIGISTRDSWVSSEHLGYGSLLTASAAAFNTNMGSVSMKMGPAVAFLAAMMNLRLGLWVRNPLRGQANARNERNSGKLLIAEMLSQASVVETCSHCKNENCTTCSSKHPEFIHLSDGAHFENLGLYELVRRHCKYIIVSDCGADPQRSFDDLGNAIRRIRMDFGVEITLDVRPLKADKDGIVSQHFVVGKFSISNRQMRPRRNLRLERSSTSNPV